MDAMVTNAPAMMLVGQDKVDKRIVQTVIATTMEILVEEIEPKIASGKLDTPEKVLGVLLQVRERYAPGE